MTTERIACWRRVAIEMIYIRVTWDLSPPPLKVLIWLPVLLAVRLLRG